MENNLVKTKIEDHIAVVTLDAPRGFRPGDFVALGVTEPAIDGVARLPASAVDATGTVLVVGEGERLRAEPEASSWLAEVEAFLAQAHEQGHAQEQKKQPHLVFLPA